MNFPEHMLCLFTEGKVGNPLLMAKNWPSSLKGQWNSDIIPQHCHGECSHLLQQMAHAPKSMGQSTTHPPADANTIRQFCHLNCSVLCLSAAHCTWKSSNAFTLQHRLYTGQTLMVLTIKQPDGSFTKALFSSLVISQPPHRAKYPPPAISWGFPALLIYQPPPLINPFVPQLPPHPLPLWLTQGVGPSVPPSRNVSTKVAQMAKDLVRTYPNISKLSVIANICGGSPLLSLDKRESCYN